ncbi:hypothetical protein [Serratia oryzae]|uniref:hypothetical protein n=1 Tax=Serratia oryzae TaxID=2034155 RepID=UPI0012E17334|nr:hypothetical protein [Serratia oryzae]
MNIDALLTSKDPDKLRALALKLLADLEQQTQRNQSQTCYIQQLEEVSTPRFMTVTVALTIKTAKIN